MKNYLFILVIYSLSALGSGEQFWQYPEDRTYTNADRGMFPYRATSIYKTGTFALTFDDGPHLTQTPKILDILKKHQVHATFFVLTEKLSEKTLPLFKRILDEGHMIGSHGPSHDRARSLNQAEFKRQVKDSFLSLATWYKKSGHEFTKHYFRFPYGDYGNRADYHHMNALKEVSQELMGDNCINMVFWDIDTADWVPGMSANEVASNIIAFNEGGTFIDFKLVNGQYIKNPIVIRSPPSGGVILQHDIRLPSVEGTELFLRYAEQRNLRIAALNEVEEFKITRKCKL